MSHSNKNLTIYSPTQRNFLTVYVLRRQRVINLKHLGNNFENHN